MASAVNILRDCSCAILFSATDLGGGETFTGSISFKADTIEIDESQTIADHSTAQDAVELNRSNKVSWKLTVNTKFYSSALHAAIRTNALARIIVTAPTGMGVTAEGIIASVGVTLSGPSTEKFELASHGVALSYS